MARFQREERGYANVQGTKPQTLGMALNDSPAGLARVDRREVPHLERLRRRPGELLHPRPAHHERDAVLGDGDDHVFGAPVLGDDAQRRVSNRSEYVAAPTGVARYPEGGVLRFPRPWVEQSYNVTHWADDAAWWPLRRHGATRPVRRRPAGLLPYRALNDPSRLRGRQAISGCLPGRRSGDPPVTSAAGAGRQGLGANVSR